MRVFSSQQANQGGDLWHDLRRGIVTGSEMPRVLSPIKYATGGQAKYLADLCAAVAHPEDYAPNWLTEHFNRPPNHAIEEGTRREQESRDWIEFDRGVTVEQVGFCLHENGLWGCSPDGILIADSGCMDGTLELKNPMPETQAAYLLDGHLPPEYKCQVHGHLIVTGLAKCLFLSYHHDFTDKLLVEVGRDDFTARLVEELTAFSKKYLDALTRLKLLVRWEFLRKNTLAHFPREAA